MKKILAVLLAVLLLAGCGSNAGGASGKGGNGSAEAVEINVEELYEKLEACGIPAMLDLDQDMQQALYGIAKEDVKQSLVKVCEDALRADEIWLIEASDAEAAQRIKTLADNRVQQKDDESITYDPEQNAIVRKSFVTVEGNYVFFICSPDVEAMTKIVNEALDK